MKKLVLIFTALACVAQKPPATITGRVFAITRGGDLKPARLADLFVFVGNEARLTIARETSNAIEKLSEAPPPYPPCGQVRAYETAVTKGISKTSNFVKAKSDEEGKINVGVPASLLSETIPTGATVIAIGRAGLNDAAWESRFDIESGKTVEIKMESPEVSCVSR